MRKNGWELRAEIKADDRLKRIPVVIMTSSEAEDDIGQAYGLHANSYIVKPMDFPKFVAAVQAIDRYWFSTVILPQP